MKGHFYNLISNLKNGQIVNKAFVINENSRICRKVLDILWDEGFILGYKILPVNKLKIYLKYRNGNSVIRSIKVVSKPSLRVYYSVRELRRLKKFLILTTHKGIKTISNCKRLNIGGEPLIMLK
jgi:small subunit ribosomal protein S8